MQASERQADGTVRVSVYLNDIANLGGIDAELVFDQGKAAYVGSGLGESFKEGYGTTNYNEGSNTVKCVTVYPEAKTAHGELMYAIFQLKGIESYQPEFKVVDILDASEEIHPIPYTITYQQADGSWTDAQDTSETAAEEQVIAQAREDYGAPEDKEQHSLRASSGGGTASKGASENDNTDSNRESGNGSSGNEGAGHQSGGERKPRDDNSENNHSGNGDTKGSIPGDGEREADPGKETEHENKGTETDRDGKQSNIMIIGITVIVIVIIILAAVLITVWSKKHWRKRNGR